MGLTKANSVTIICILGSFVFLELSAGTALAQEPIRIGASVGLTGAYAEIGLAIERGYLLCVKQANAKGGILGRKLELTVVDDQSVARVAVAAYERLIVQDKVDLVFSPYSTPLTDAVADLTEKYGKPMVASGAATPSIFRKGRRFLFMLLPPSERYFEGVINLAAKRGLKTLGVVYEDTPFPKAMGQGAAELAKKRGLQVVALEGYPLNTKDFTPMLARFKLAVPDVIAAAGYYDDGVAITKVLKELDVNPKMFAPVIGSGVPKFRETLGSTGEYVYGATPWEAMLAEMRAGGLVPIARQYPGIKELVESYRTEFSSSDVPYHVAQGYGACQVLLEAVRRTGTLDGEKIRAAIARHDSPTTFGAFKVDQDGVQVAHRLLVFQWQDGKKVIVWPDELAPEKPRFPTPPWRQRP